MTKIIPLIPLLLAAGCVTTGKFQAQQAETAAQSKRATDAETKAAGLQKDLDALKLSHQQATEAGQKIQGQLKAANDQVANLQQSNKDAQAALEANKGQLSKQVSDLIKERDGVKAAAVDKDKQINDLQIRLATADAEKKALASAKEAELARVKQSYEDLTSGLKSEIAAGQVTITQLKGKLTLNMVDKILFDSGMAEVKTDGKKVLDKVGTVLSSVADKDIRIEGHTDNKPITAALASKYPTNWELSTARATAVARYLEDNAKIDGKRLVAAGYGEFRPITSNETPDGRAQNRRIEIVLVPKE
jgi:chemotaxis protein MotB